jgi:hypothetical protein
VPRERGEITAIDVMHAAPGGDRETAIDLWCASVWGAFRANRHAIMKLLLE